MIYLSPRWGFGVWGSGFLYTYRPAGAFSEDAAEI